MDSVLNLATWSIIVVAIIIVMAWDDIDYVKGGQKDIENVTDNKFIALAFTLMVAILTLISYMLIP